MVFLPVTKSKHFLCTSMVNSLVLAVQVNLHNMSSQDEIKVMKAIDMEKENRLSTGCEKLDQLLHGGLPSEGIVEISGESGCGKTQLCKQLTLTVQYPVKQGGFEGGAIYICTEERFHTKRLYQLIENFPKQFYRHDNNVIDFGSNILIFHVSDFENMEKCLKQIPGILGRKNIKLIIIDSITAIFRGEYTQSEWRKKVTELRSIGSLLHNLSACHNLLIVCVNQVSQCLNSGKTVPALGLAWANLITSRIFMSRNGSLRTMEVIFSPELPSNIPVNFSIGDSGIYSL